MEVINTPLEVPIGNTVTWPVTMYDKNNVIDYTDDEWTVRAEYYRETGGPIGHTDLTMTNTTETRNGLTGRKWIGTLSLPATPRHQSLYVRIILIHKDTGEQQACFQRVITII
ncbi:hypothetical protein DYU11_20010 [Fibrisoma montanum]|uniref:Uncharacterized protein n=1 Tax=Fibrisoma montanum TaxID=2305895 RepID=A0A418M3P9_9BACT|nr:hypothetical protein [Fibrisoma montanum]RIV20339.1 hypothetical protein DYU11_20010 [Fibrisoma montanum]